MAFLREGYDFLPNRRHGYQSNIVRRRLMGEPAVALSGAEGAKLFYDEAYLQRTGAIPRRIQTRSWASTAPGPWTVRPTSTARRYSWP